MLNAETLFQAATYAKKLSINQRAFRIRLDTMGLLIDASVATHRGVKNTRLIVSYEEAEQGELDFLRLKLDEANKELNHV